MVEQVGVVLHCVMHCQNEIPEAVIPDLRFSMVSVYIVDHQEIEKTSFSLSVWRMMMLV